MGVVFSTVSGKCRSCTTCSSTSRLSHPSGDPIGVSVIAMRPRWRSTRAASSDQISSGGGSSIST